MNVTKDTLALLILALQSSLDERQGNVVSHQEADAHFRKKLKALKPIK